MQKTSQDKKTPNLADAREELQCWENPLINSSYYYIKSSVEREYKNQIDLPNSSQNNPVNVCSQTSALTKKSMLVKSEINHPKNSSVFTSQTW